MAPLTLRQQMTADRLDQFAQAWLRFDLDALGAFLSTDVVYSPTCGELIRGRDAVVRRFAEVLAEDAQNELRFEPARVSGSLGTCRWRLAGRTSDRGSFEIEGIDVYEFEGDLIRLKDVYQKT